MRIIGNAAARIVTVDGEILDARPSQKLRNHSPDGFNWGYHGSGPAQLALAILLAARVPRDIALAYYQQFKRTFVGTWPLDQNFDVKIDVPAWIADQLAKEKNA